MSSSGKAARRGLVLLLIAFSTAVFAEDAKKVTLTVEGFQKARSGAT